MVCPLPWEFKGPEKCHDLREAFGACKDQDRCPKHLKKHGKEENQEAVAKGFAFHPLGNIVFARETKTATEEAKELSASAVAIAIAFVALSNRNDEGHKEANEAQPGKQDIEKS